MKKNMVLAVVCLAIGMVSCSESRAINYETITTAGSTWTYLHTQNSATYTNTEIITESSDTFINRKTQKSDSGPTISGSQVVNNDYSISHEVLLPDDSWGVSFVDHYTELSEPPYSYQSSASFSPPLPISPSQWVIGNHDTGSVRVQYNAIGVMSNRQYSASYDMTVVGIESVSVPAGTFDAVKVVKNSSSFLVGGTSKETRTIWFANGIGIVKQSGSLSYGSPAGPTEWTEMLTNYSIK